jgi:hypothetical protein
MVTGKNVGFIFKSIFWVGIVCLFLPQDPAALKTPKAVASLSSTTVIDAASAGAKFCQKQPEICESALKTGAASRDILTKAAATLGAQLSDKSE